ncbi:MAG: YrhK family protein [Alphaproteobacteria bacterium]|nr:YrhK family protein [Alphaproteobacteria bacterium]MDX5367923.1 YrhK family protein [Alphaproteobacteria bacterium]MDX5462776.1 YrhK family protein [Alphaproteobacteria bacterium]
MTDTDLRRRREVSRRVRGVETAYSLLRLLADFLAATLFLAGSIAFLWPDWQRFAIWCFIVGSVFFFLKPAARLASYAHASSIAREAKVELEALERRMRPF